MRIVRIGKLVRLLSRIHIQRDMFALMLSIRLHSKALRHDAVGIVVDRRSIAKTMKKL